LGTGSTLRGWCAVGAKLCARRRVADQGGHSTRHSDSCAARSGGIEGVSASMSQVLDLNHRRADELHGRLNLIKAARR